MFISCSIRNCGTDTFCSFVHPFIWLLQALAVFLEHLLLCSTEILSHNLCGIDFNEVSLLICRSHHRGPLSSEWKQDGSRQHSETIRPGYVLILTGLCGKLGFICRRLMACRWGTCWKIVHKLDRRRLINSSLKG